MNDPALEEVETRPGCPLAKTSTSPTFISNASSKPPSSHRSSTREKDQSERKNLGSFSPLSRKSKTAETKNPRRRKSRTDQTKAPQSFRSYLPCLCITLFSPRRSPPSTMEISSPEFKKTPPILTKIPHPSPDASSSQLNCKA